MTTRPTPDRARRLVAALGTLTLSGTLLVALGASPAMAAAPICGTFQRAAVSDDAYVVQNNAWGDTPGQCVQPEAGGFTITKAEGDLEFGGAPKSYPSIFAGEHYDEGSNTASLPVKVSKIGSARTSAKITKAPGAWNAAWDVWVNSSPDSPDENDDTEIMVWANQQGGPTPIGDNVDTITVEGRDYNVWKGTGPGGTDVVSYVDVETTTAPDIPLAPFLEDAIKRGATSPDSYVTSVQFGFEPWKAGEGLAVDDFTYSPSSDGTPAPTAGDDDDEGQQGGEDAGKDEPAKPAGKDDQADAEQGKDQGKDGQEKAEGDFEEVALADEPAALITTPQGKGKAVDAAKPQREVTVHGDVATTTAPDGSPAVVLNDREDYLEVADSPDLSIPTTGQLTVEMLMRPDVVEDLPGAEPSGDGPMVAPLVKGSQFASGGDQDYAVRLYDQDSSRPGRTSAYAFDPAGGQGAGSYAQQDLEAGQWTHLAVVYDTENTGKDGWGTVTFYRDGVKADTHTLGGDHEITPADGDSPLFIGGDGHHSSFTGAIGAVVITPTALSGKQVAAHAHAALNSGEGQDEPAGKSQGEDAGKDQGAGDEAADGERLIPIPDEDS